MDDLVKLLRRRALFARAHGFPDEADIDFALADEIERLRSVMAFELIGTGLAESLAKRAEKMAAKKA